MNCEPNPIGNMSHLKSASHSRANLKEWLVTGIHMLEDPFKQQVSHAVGRFFSFLQLRILKRQDCGKNFHSDVDTRRNLKTCDLHTFKSLFSGFICYPWGHERKNLLFNQVRIMNTVNYMKLVLIKAFSNSSLLIFFSKFIVQEINYGSLRSPCYRLPALTNLKFPPFYSRFDLWGDNRTTMKSKEY